MTIRKKQFNKAKSKSYANDYVENLILDKLDSFLFNIFFVSLQPKRSAIDCTIHRISSRLRPLYMDV